MFLNWDSEGDCIIKAPHSYSGRNSHNITFVALQNLKVSQLTVGLLQISCVFWKMTILIAL